MALVRAGQIWVGWDAQTRLANFESQVIIVLLVPLYEMRSGISSTAYGKKVG